MNPMTVNNIRNPLLVILLFLVGLVFRYSEIIAQNITEEADYYRITTVPVPEGIHLEVGGVEVLPDGSVAVCTRRGDVWIVQNPTMRGGTRPLFQKFASGLHEPLGLVYLDGVLYTVQRGELTKLVDTDGDRVANIYQTIYALPISTHYHEYAFGPVLTPDSSFFVTTNVAFGNQEWWRGESRVPWRGWTLKISQDGEMEPWATGMRSPAGPGLIDGEFFYTDNQGDWVGSGGLWHVPKGAFIGHPAGLRWTGEEGSPLKLTEEQFYAKIDKRQVAKDGVYLKPENIQDEDPDFLYELREEFPELQLPAVILPHGILGISNSEVKVDQTGGKFGPFEGQVFIGDQGQSKIMRIVLEKVNGQYQGVAFDFRAGFQSGVLRMDWDNQGNLFVGETNRGWGSAGTTNSGLEYVTWTGKTPFEMKTVNARPDGFEIEFTLPVAKEQAEDLDSYTGISYVYKYHAVYGSPQTNIEELKIKGVKVSEDGMKVRLVVDNLRQYHVHEIHAMGLRSQVNGDGLLHPSAYYTLNNIPEGDNLPMSELSVKRSSASAKRKTPQKTFSKSRNTVPTYAEIQPLLTKNTCMACHQANKQVVGPSFMAVARRKYSNQKIVDLIYNPQPQNWPGFASPMAPMPQVPKDEALQIAAWINSLDDHLP